MTCLKRHPFGWPPVKSEHPKFDTTLSVDALRHHFAPAKDKQVVVVIGATGQGFHHHKGPPPNHRGGSNAYIIPIDLTACFVKKMVQFEIERHGGRDWAATGRTRERGRRRTRLARSRHVGCGLVRLVRLVRTTCEGDGEKRRIDLLVLANRCGEAENFLKLVGVLLHRSAILTDAGEHAKGVSPETRSEGKVASLLEVLPRDGRIFQLQAKADGSSHPSKRGNSNRANFGVVAAGTSDGPVACASSAGGRLPCWLPESSVAGPFSASSCRSICLISPCSVCIAVTTAWRAWTDSAEAYSPMTSGFDTKFVVGSGS
nr:hypothetical protein Iba_chr05fCG7090 [Ipomoea batatas]GMD93442.1 hypothetical protein Iba_chr14fCG7480 [Ipomoea batatas]